LGDAKLTITETTICSQIVRKILYVIMKSSRRFKRNISFNALATASGSVTQFLLILTLTRLLSVDTFASFVTASAVVAVAEMTSDFGVRIWAVRRFALGTSSGETLFLAVTAKGFFSALMALVVVLVPWQLLNHLQAALCVLVAMLQPATDPLLWFLRGKERLDVEAIAVLSWRIGNALVLGIAAWLGASLSLLLSLWLGSSLLRLFFVARLSLVRELFATTRQVVVPVVLRQGLGVVQTAFPIGLAFLLMAFYQRLGVFSLGILGDTRDVALFGVAFVLVTSAGFLATSVTVASFPSLARSIEAGALKDAEFVVRRKLKLIALLFFPSCILGALIAPWFIPIAYPASYLPAATVVIGLAPGLFISAINFSLKYLLNALHLNWLDACSVVAGVFVFITVLVLPRWNVLLDGAAFAWCGGEMAIFLTKWYILFRDGRLPVKILAVYFILFVFLWIFVSLMKVYIMHFYGY